MKLMSLQRLILCGAVAATVLSSCNNEKDYYDPSKANEIKTAERLSAYQTAFKSIYGAIPASQEWDFSGPATLLANNETRALGESLDPKPAVVKKNGENGFVIPDKLLTWMKGELPEGGDYRKTHTLTPFDLFVSNKAHFYIIPLYQGGASTEFDFNLKFKDGKYVKLWTKGDMEKKETADSNWETVGLQGTTLDKTSWNGKSWNTYAVRGPIFDIDPAQQPFADYVGTQTTEFVLITKGSNNYSTTGTILESTSGWMTKLDVPESALSNADMEAITGKATGNEAMIIGCEVAHLSGSDYDYNDMVFLVVGNPLPPVIETTQKRYMVEDLGTSQASDIDFNDIVVDFIRTNKKVDSSVMSISETTETKAIIRAMGGTLDFDLCVGDPNGQYDILFTKKSEYNVGTMYNTGVVAGSGTNHGTGSIDYFKEMKVITGEAVEKWDPKTNNVFVKVRETASVTDSQLSEGQNHQWIIKFPQKGEVPMMLAFDLGKEWRFERDAITSAECGKDPDHTYNWFSNDNKNW